MRYLAFAGAAFVVSLTAVGCSRPVGKAGNMPEEENLDALVPHRAESHEHHLTRGKLFTAAYAICEYEAVHGRLPALEGWMTTLVHEKPALQGRVVYDEHGRPALRDWWGRDLQLAVLDNQEFRVWSVGPNGENEDGAGDDVVMASAEFKTIRERLRNPK